MKKTNFLLLLLIISGCLFPIARSMRTIVSSVDEYTVTITDECDATQLKKIQPETASFYIEFGCDSCLVADFRKGSIKITVEATSFHKSKGAMGAFFSTDIPGSQPLELGFIGRQSDSAIEFLKGRHIVLVRPEHKNEMPAALELARSLEKRIPGDTIKPDIYESLPKTQKVPDSELYFAGKKTFELGFSRDLAEMLRIGGAVDGAAAEYTVDDTKVIFIMVKYVGRKRTLSAVNSYLNSRKDRPIIRPRESLDYYTVIESDRSESYIAENGDWLYLLMDGPRNGRAQPFFTYVLRGGR